MSTTAIGRPLAEIERRVLAHLLSVDFVGHRATPAATPSAGCPQLETGWIPKLRHLDLPDSPLSSFDGKLAPIKARVSSAEEPYIGELILWIANSRLSSLEYSWITDHPPTTLPDPASIYVSLKK